MSPHSTNPVRGATLRALGLGAALALAASPLTAQDDERELGWFRTAELSFVLTSGNAESSTLGLSGEIRRVWERSEFRFDAGGVRTSSSRSTRSAVGSVADFDLVEDSDSEVTAERYFARGRYDRIVSERVFAFGGAGWERNTFAGFDSRISLVAGVGNTWVERDDAHFKTDLGLTFTVQDDVTGSDTQSFAGLRAGWDYRNQLTETTELKSLLVLDENLDETDDLRADFTNSLTVAMSEALALRTSLKLLWDNLPSLVGVPLEQPAGTPTGETVLVPLDKLDSQFTVALVLNF